MTRDEQIAAAQAVLARVKGEHRHTWLAVYRASKRGPRRVPTRRCDTCGAVEDLGRSERELARDDDILRAATQLASRGEFGIVLGGDDTCIADTSKKNTSKKNTHPGFTESSNYSGYTESSEVGDCSTGNPA